MALSKIVKEDKIEIIGDYKAVQVRTVTVINEGNVKLSESYHRHVISAGEDYSNESKDVQAICSLFHTDAIVAAYKAHLKAQEE